MYVGAFCFWGWQPELRRYKVGFLLFRVDTLGGTVGGTVVILCLHSLITILKRGTLMMV